MSEVTEKSSTKDTRFNPSRLPSNGKAAALVEDIRAQLLNYERHHQLRQRARRPADQARFDRMVTAIVCDLVHAALVAPESWRHISLSKRRTGQDEVGAPFMTEERIRLIKWMAAPELDWLELQKGYRSSFGRQQTRLRASARLIARMEDHDIQLEDLTRDPALMGDPIVLRGPKVRGKAKPLAPPSGEPTQALRSDMLRINGWLSDADIACDYDRRGNIRDTGNRWLRRIFNDGRMDQGGRLYGGFWQSMSVEDRLADIQINGQSVASLDFGQCGVRIAYGLTGAQPPTGDLYCVPGLERHRDGVKAVLNAMLSRTGSMSRKPVGTAKLFPRHLKAREIEEAIFKHHSPLRDLCFAGQGLTIQYIESRVLVRCLLGLGELQLPALPVHDCLLVPISAVDAVRDLMLQSFREVAGVEGSIGVEHGHGLPSSLASRTKD